MLFVIYEYVGLYYVTFRYQGRCHCARKAFRRANVNRKL